MLTFDTEDNLYTKITIDGNLTVFSGLSHGALRFFCINGFRFTPPPPKKIKVKQFCFRIKWNSILGQNRIHLPPPPNQSKMEFYLGQNTFYFMPPPTPVKWTNLTQFFFLLLN